MTVVGQLDGDVWGTGIYTSDSNIHAAAVHAGVVAVGQSRTIQIQRLSGQASYQGSPLNGVISKDYGKWGHSFCFLGVDLQRLDALAVGIGQHGWYCCVLFVIAGASES